MKQIYSRRKETIERNCGCDRKAWYALDIVMSENVKKMGVRNVLLSLICDFSLI